MPAFRIWEDLFYLVNIQHLYNIRVLRREFNTLHEANRAIKKFLKSSSLKYEILTGKQLLYYKLNKFYQLRFYCSKYDFPETHQEPFRKQVYRTNIRKKQRLRLRKNGFYNKMY